jgi:hydroxyacyl-ACP dehydratase HTD2-like protein with hotdog domain
MTMQTTHPAHEVREADALKVGDTMEPVTNRPTEVQLFRYCAVSWNSHRIHYDRDWAASEGYPHVLVQSHLHGAFFTRFVFDWAGANGRVERVAYSVRRFAIPGDELTMEGTVVGIAEDEDGITVSLELREVRHADGTVCAIGDADVRFPRVASGSGQA